MTSPPRLALWLLSRALPARDRDEVIGDLAEDFSERVAASGRIAAVRWYWYHALRLIWTLGAQPPIPNPPVRGRLMSVDDLRYAIRQLIKQPGAALGSIITLAFSIGAGVAAWTLLSAVLLHPVPIRNPAALAVVGERGPSQADPFGRSAPLRNEHNYTVYPEVRASGILDAVAAGGSWPALLTIDGSSSNRQVYFATYDLFDTLGIRPQAGRGILPADDQRGAPPVALLSDRAWRRAFAARPDAIGRTIQVNGHQVTIVGIAPHGFHGPTVSESPDLYLPFHIVGEIGGPQTNWFADPSMQTSPTSWVRIFGRLKPGVSVEQTVAALASLPAGPSGRPRVFELTDVNTAALAEAVRPKMKEFARLVGITVTMLLIIGCLTAGMLLLLRTEARRGEFAMCLALGATRARLGVGVLIEGALLSLAGAALAVPVSWWLLAGLRTFQLPGDINIDLLEVTVDAGALAAAAGAAIVATLFLASIAGGFGFAANIADALRARSGVTPRMGRRRTRDVLVVAEIALALVLLTGAGLFVRSLTAALHLNPGYDTSRIASGTVALGPHGYTPDRATTFFRDFRDRLMRHSEIASASMIQSPGGMGAGGRLIIDGEPVTVPSFVAFNAIDERYFPTIGLSLSAGRNFSGDDGDESPRVAVVSASLARLVGGHAIGRRIQALSNAPGKPKDQIEIVGIVPDIVTNVRTLEPLVLYTPIAQARSSTYRMVIVRAAHDAAAAIRETIATAHAMEPALPVPFLATIDDALGRQMGPQRFGATVLGALGGIAALLTFFGIYVLAESMSALRRREMGVRAALGASRPQLSRLILAETARLIGAGILVGAALAWFGAGLIRGFLFRVEPFDAATVTTVVGSVLFMAFAVSLRPALRAGRVDLARVLRDE